MSKFSPIRPVLDLNKRHFSHVKHGLEVIGTWYRESGRRWSPCMVLLPLNKPSGRRVVPVIIPLTEAWRWAMHGEVGDPGHVFAKITEWLSEGILPGLPLNRRDYMQIMDAVNSYLPDLIAMPPRPKGETASIAEVTIQKATGEIIEREIVDDV